MKTLMTFNTDTRPPNLYPFCEYVDVLEQDVPGMLKVAWSETSWAVEMWGDDDELTDQSWKAIEALGIPIDAERPFYINPSLVLSFYQLREV